MGRCPGRIDSGQGGKMKNLSLALLLAFTACSYSKQEFDDARRRAEADNAKRQDDDCFDIEGVYSGPFNVGKNVYEVALAVNCQPAGADHILTPTVRIKRTDIYVRDVSLPGTYKIDTKRVSFNRVQEGNGNESFAAFEFNALKGEVIPRAQIGGTLSDKRGVVGEFVASRDYSLPNNLSQIDICHPFYDSLRNRTFETSGLYEAEIDSDPRHSPAFLVTLKLHPTGVSNLSLIVDLRDNREGTGEKYVADYVPHEGNGALFIYDQTGRLNFSLSRDKQNNFSGKYRTKGGKSYDATFVKKEAYRPSPEERCEN
jgi:hypothetical protein